MNAPGYLPTLDDELPRAYAVRPVCGLCPSAALYWLRGFTKVGVIVCPEHLDSALRAALGLRAALDLSTPTEPVIVSRLH